MKLVSTLCGKCCFKNSSSKVIDLDQLAAINPLFFRRLNVAPRRIENIVPDQIERRVMK